MKTSTDDDVRRAKQAEYMREWNRSSAGRAAYKRARIKRAAYHKKYREENLERYLAREKKYAQSKMGRKNAAERSRAWQKRHPKRYAESKKRYRETEKGKLQRWSTSAAARARVFANIRRDGRIQNKPGGNVTAKQLRELWQQQDGKCALTGRKLLLLNGTQHLDSPSVDRIDKKLWYEISNLRLVTYQTNCARLFGSDEDLFIFCGDILSYKRKHIENYHGRLDRQC